MKGKNIRQSSLFSKKINLSEFLWELNNSQLKKEERAEKIMHFCLDYLNQDVKETWRQKRNRALLLTSMAEYEFKATEKEAVKEIMRQYSR